MTRPLLLLVFLAVMIAVIVGVDVLFFRDHFWERLISNISIVVAFIALYWMFLK